MRRTVIGSIVGVIAAVALGATPALAASGYSLFGDATLAAGHDSPTGVQVSSDAATTYGGISFAVPAGLTFDQISALSTDYNFLSGSCALGSPRFSVETSEGNVFFYIGPAPNYTGCASGWTNSGNLALSGNLIDTSQLPGGTFYDTFAAAVSRYAGLAITGIALVSDNGPQTVVVDNVQVNSTTYTFESAATCKDGGWKLYGSMFKNQGDCVSFYATGGTNLPG